MTPTNGLIHYTDERILLAIGKILKDRNGGVHAITQAEIAAGAFVCSRTVHASLHRLTAMGYIVVTDRKQGRIAKFALSDKAKSFVEDNYGRLPDCK